jgi:CubicO group peptidase (beta-lactamase class C family)
MFRNYQDLFIQKITAVILLTLGIAAVNVSGQQNMNVKASLSEPEAAKKVDAFLAQWDKKDMPGCAVGAVLNGKLIYNRAFGLANLDYDVPNTNLTLFNLASASKPFTAMSVALLAEQGKLSFDDDVRKYIPELPKYDQPITIRHLLYHTSGIREYQALVFFGGQNSDNALSDKAVMNMLARQKNISFAPGSKHQYSNSNYHLLGIIVGRVSGKSLREFADENIFKPLGMKNTRFFDNRQEVVKNRASGYLVARDNSVRARASLFDLVGGGGVLTTVEDLALWNQNFAEPKVGSRETIQLMTMRGTLNDGEKIGYSFGLFHNKYRGLPVIKHSGNMSGFRAQMISFPEQKFTSIALCNNSAIFPSVIAEKLADIYLDSQFKPDAPTPKKVDESLPPAIALPEKDLRRLVGFYGSRETGAAFKIALKEGKLFSSGLLPNEAALIPLAANRFLMMNDNSRIEMTPAFDKAGAVSEIKLIVGGGNTDSFAPFKAPLDSPQALAEYAGIYHSDELDADYNLTVEGKNLVLRIGENFENKLNAAYADYFTIRGGAVNIAFKRDAQGKITGLTFNSSADDREIKGIEFQRK